MSGYLLGAETFTHSLSNQNINYTRIVEDTYLRLLLLSPVNIAICKYNERNIILKYLKFNDTYVKTLG